MIEQSPIIVRFGECTDPVFRLVCFPHGGGGAQAFREWTHLLPSDIELLCVNLPGRGSRFAESNFEDMDALTSAVIDGLGAYADTPFAFFGHSMGALVAYETARKLETEKLPSPFLVIASAHKAPQVAPDDPAMYTLSDSELTQIVLGLGMVPAEALRERGFVEQVLLPPLRADFKLAELYDRGRVVALSAPILAMGGLADDQVNQSELGQWREATMSNFEVAMFDGDHFYTQSSPSDVVKRILQGAEDAKGLLGESISVGAPMPYPERTLHELLHERAIETPDAPALIDGSKTISLAELDSLSSCLADYLCSVGQSVGSRVAVLMDTSSEYVIALFGILKAGGAYVSVDRAQPPAALVQIFRKASVDVVLTKESFRNHLPANWDGTRFELDEGWSERLKAKALPNASAGVNVDIDAPAQIVFSSGTTGEPKGIVCPHRSAVNSYYWRYEYLPYSVDEREACNVFLVWEVMRPILRGLPAYIIPDDTIYDPPRLVDYLKRNQVSRVLFTPSLADQILNTKGIDFRHDLASLRVVYLNGEVITASLKKKILAALPHVNVVNDYSIAETHDVSHASLRDATEQSPKVAVVGHPMENVSIYILDGQHKPVPFGFSGEVYVGGHSVGHGYLGAPELTAERFVSDPFLPGRLMFRTGDEGRLSHSGLEVKGRKAFMVKLRGYSVVPSAIEAALCEHENVASAAVLVENNADSGQPERLIAYVVLRLVSASWEADLRSHMKLRVPQYAIPGRLIQIDDIPIASTGKLDRSKLKESAASPAKVASPAKDADNLLRHVREIWLEVLRIDMLRDDDDFFDRGGHSLLAASACALIHERIGIRVPVVDLYQFPRLNEFVDHLKGSNPSRTQGGTTPKQKGASQIRTQAAGRLVGGPLDIAIIGMSARFPGADDVDRFWSNLCQNHSAIRPLTDQELRLHGVTNSTLSDPSYVKAGAFLDGVDQFDADFWGISRREAILMDPQQRIFLECCWKALEAAGYAPNAAGQNTAVYAGSFLPLYQRSQTYRDTFDKCATMCHRLVRRDLRDLVYGDHSNQRLDFVEINAAIFAVQFSMASMLNKLGVRPSSMVGHSMSEYVVASLAGILSPEDSLKLMLARAKAMMELKVDGAMLAVKCSEATAHILLADPKRQEDVVKGNVAIGVVNSPTSVVLTGVRGLLLELHAEFEQAGVPSQLLDTGGIPSHSKLMAPCGSLIDEQAASLLCSSPKLDIALNVTGALYSDAPIDLQGYWSQQIQEPVRFEAALKSVLSQNPDVLIDIGPSQNLLRFAAEALDERGNRHIAHVATEILAAMKGRHDKDDTDRQALLRCLGGLWEAGVALDWQAVNTELEPEARVRRIPLPTYSFDRKRYWPEHPKGVTATRNTQAGPYLYSESWVESPRLRTAYVAGHRTPGQTFVLMPKREPGRGGPVALAQAIVKRLEDMGESVVQIFRQDDTLGIAAEGERATIAIPPTVDVRRVQGGYADYDALWSKLTKLGGRAVSYYL